MFLKALKGILLLFSSGVCTITLKQPSNKSSIPFKKSEINQKIRIFDLWQFIRFITSIFNKPREIDDNDQFIFATFGLHFILIVDKSEIIRNDAIYIQVKHHYHHTSHIK